MTAVRFVLFGLRLLFYLLFSPFILLWVVGRAQYCRMRMIRSMTREGMPRKFAREIAKDVKFVKLFHKIVA